MPRDNPEYQTYSQTQGYGMVPVYSETRGESRGTQGEFLGYEFNPIKAGIKKIEVPKPKAILDVEKKVGNVMEPVYQTFSPPEPGQGRRGGGAGDPVEYGAPIGYRYDNGNSQYVNFDAQGKYQDTTTRTKPNLLPILALLAAPFIAPAIGGLFGAEAAGAAAAGAGTLGAAEGALTAAELASLPGAATGIGTLGTAAALSPEMIAAGTFTPGSVGALGATSGALTGAELAAASGIGSLGAELAALPAAEVASLPGATTSVNEMIASGMAPGSAGATGAATGALTPAELAAASGVTDAGIASLPAAGKSVNEMIASGMSPGSAGAAGAATGALTPAELAAASGVVTTGATPALVEMAKQGAQDYIDAGGSAKPGAGGGPGGTDVIKSASSKEAVASGLSPGSAGAKAAAEGTLTPAELAAAAGTAAAGSKSGITDLLDKAKNALTGGSSTGSGTNLGGTLGLLALMSMMNKGSNAPAASTATIPELTATRTQLPYDVDKKGVNPNTPYRPGQGGVTYFSPTTYTPKAAGGGLMSLGGLGSYSDGGRLLQGPGDGVSDSIPAIIGKKQPARLANGEFVIPARIVSELGNGSTDAGAKRLYEMMDRVQKVRRKTKNVAANTKAAKYLPA